MAKLLKRRINSFFQNWDQFSICLLILAFLLRVVVSVAFQGRVWIDEIWVVLEPAYRMFAGLPHVDILDWQQGIRSVLPPAIYYFFIQVMHFLGIEKGIFVLPLLRMVLCMAVFFTQIFFLKEIFNALNLKQKKYHVFSVFIFFFSPELLHYSVSADLSVLGAPFLLLGLGYWSRWASKAVQNTKQSKQSIILSAVFLSLASLIRFQYALFPLGFFLSLLLQKKHAREALILVLIGLKALLIQVVLDSIYYGKLTFSLYRYFTLNTSGGLAASFGTSPFTHGLEIFWRFATEPLFLGVFVLIPFALKKIPALYFTSLAFLILHCFIGHKEYRFFYGAALVFSALVPALLQNLVELKKIKPQILTLFFVLFLGIASYRGFKKVGWQDFESPSYLETVAGSQNDVKGIMSYGWGGIYSGGNFTVFGSKPYRFFMSKADVLAAKLNAEEYNYVVAPQSHPPACSTLVRQHLGAVLYRCDKSEMQRFLR